MSSAAPCAPRLPAESGEIHLRPVETGDGALLRAIYASTRAEELALTNWSEEQKAAFCEQQFTAQDTFYRQEYPAMASHIIERAGVPAGRLYVHRGQTGILIIDIALLPEHRGAGIGTRFLRELQEEARASQCPLTIHVEKFNPAIRLYLRLGFVAKEDTGVYFLMEWQA